MFVGSVAGSMDAGGTQTQTTEKPELFKAKTDVMQLALQRLRVRLPRGN
jgi:hypothetical protein